MEKSFLKNFYKEMLKIRLCEESLIDPILKKEIKCPVHLYTGQEAVAVGVCSVLKKNDYVFSNHRSHGHYLAKGGNLNKMIAEIYTKETGCSKGRGGSMHVIDIEKGFLGSAPIISGTIALGLGAALVNKIKKNKNVAVVFFGDGALGEGVLYESLNFAALKKLPIIFVCENNLYSTHLPVRECRPNTPIYKIAEPFGISTIQIDGNDVIKVFDETQKAVDTCRKGSGPVFMECLTYRLRGHVGPDDNIHGTHTDIRPLAEIEKWQKKDPIKKLENFLIKDKILNKKEIQDIKKNIEKQICDAHKFAEQSICPIVKDLKKYVFKE